MFFDWIAREGGALLSWWLLALLAGIAVFPLIYRLLGALPSRGYALARAAGLLLIGFLFWLFGNLGLLWNTPGSVILVALVVFGVGLVSYFSWTDREPILPWLRQNAALIITTESLFVVLFVGWAAVRALNPDMSTTEHPMDIAFLSAIRRSANFPPHDPWLSGYAISYYYFGYFLIAMVANLTPVSNGMAFSLGIALVFAMAGTGAFGLAYDLVTSRVRRRRRVVRPWPGLSVGILACVMFVLMGNLGTGFVEMPYQAKAVSPGYLSWLDLRYRPPDMSGCQASGSADPATWGCGWWWWAYSRVVKDYNLGGADIGDVITEFPNFSFILSDLHPHVTALPFAVVTLGLAFNLALRKRRLAFWELVLYAVYFGGMTFLNSWDAIYIGMFVGAEALRRLIAKDGSLAREDWLGIAGMSAGLLALIGVFYLPFFLSFKSQVQGILPDVIWPTQFAQFFLMFGPFIVILGIFLLVEVLRAGRSFNLSGALKSLGWVLAFGVLAILALGVVAWIKPDIRSMVYRLMDESGGLFTAIPAILSRRVQGVVTEGVLLLAIFVVIGRLFVRKPPAEEEMESEPSKQEKPRKDITYSPTTGFVLLLIGAGAVLTLACDFVYLHDGFGYRINTIFKLYYQTWVMWSIASAFALWSVFSEPIPSRAQFIIRPALSFAAVILIIAGLMFPVAAITTRGFKDGGHVAGVSTPMTLDGSLTLASGPDDYAVIQCLSRVAQSDGDVVAEATKTGVAYNPSYGRVSALTGIPTLLGWDNHERQWRGPTFDQVDTMVISSGSSGQQTETRQDAIGKLYNTTNWNDAQAIIKRYGITYLYVGPTERRDFDPNGIAKFNNLKPVCSSGDVAAYSVASVGDLTAAGN